MLLLWLVYRCFYLASFVLFAVYFMRVSRCEHLTVSLSCFLLLSWTGSLIASLVYHGPSVVCLRDLVLISERGHFLPADIYRSCLSYSTSPTMGWWDLAERKEFHRNRPFLGLVYELGHSPRAWGFAPGPRGLARSFSKPEDRPILVKFV